MRDYYPIGRSYYDNHERPETNVHPDTKSTEKFKALVTSLSLKSIKDISSKEVDKLIKALKGRLTGQPGDPERELIDRAIQNIREREEMALNNSVFASAKRKHVGNIKFLEIVMHNNAIAGANLQSTLDRTKKSYLKLSEKISEKSADQITRDEVDRFLHLSLKVNELIHEIYGSQEEILSKYGDRKVDYSTINDRTIQAAIIKLEKREEIAVSESTLSKSKLRHESNLMQIRQLKSKFE